MLSRDSKTIRVIDISPVWDSSLTSYFHSDPPIKVRIRVVNLDDNSNFIALSYVCGTDAGERPNVLCDEVPIKVYRNCYSALWDLRRRLNHLTIWVDCISINAANADEKSRQTPLIGGIYAKATVAYAWLGEGGTGLQRAMSYLSTAGFQRYITTLA